MSITKVPNVMLQSPGGGGLPTLITYSTAIDLTGANYSADRTLTTNEVLTLAASPVVGSSYTVGFIGDGSHAPVTTAFNLVSGFSTYNAALYRLNLLTFGYRGVPGRTYLAITDTGLDILPPPVFTSQSAPGGFNGAPYTYTFAATYATSYVVASGSVPAGLSLNSTTGVLAGTPTATATSTFVVAATGTGGTTNSTTQTVIIAASPSASLVVNDTTSTIPGTTINLSAGTVKDWLWFRQSDGQDLEKTSASRLTRVETNVGFAAGYSGVFPNLQGSNGDVSFYGGADIGSGLGPADVCSTFYQAAGGAYSKSIVVSGVGLSTETLQFYIGGRADSGVGNGSFTFTATLSGGGASPVTVTKGGISNGTSQRFRFDVVFNAASTGQTLTVTATTSTGGGLVLLQAAMLL